MLDILIDQLAGYGFKRVTLALGFMSEQVRQHFRKEFPAGIEMDYYVERRPLGTAGALASLVDELPDTFLVVNSDTLTTLDFADMLQKHTAGPARLSVAVGRRRVAASFGVLDIDRHNIVNVREKPVLEYWANLGIYCMSRDLLRGQPCGRRTEITDLIAHQIAVGEYPQAYRFDGRWIDIGTPERYQRARRCFNQSPARFLPATSFAR